MSKIIIVSTRAPSRDMRGGMAPAVKEACQFFNDVVWYAVRNQEGLTMNFANMADPSRPVMPCKESVIAGMQIKEILVTDAMWDGHYNRANDKTWPLCHDLYHRVDSFNSEDCFGLLRVNEIMAGNIAKELNSCNDRTTPLWIHDYHHFPLPAQLRKFGVENPIIFFNHTPLPDPEQLRNQDMAIQTHFKDILSGLLACDAVNFQTEETARRFMILTNLLPPKNLPAYTSTTYAVRNGDHAIHIGHAPISIATDKKMQIAATHTQLSPEAQKLADQLTAPNILINIERCDFTKNILPRVLAFEKILERNPELAGKCQLAVGAEPTRQDLKEYREYADAVSTLVTAINEKWEPELGHKPIILLPKHIDNDDVMRLMRNSGPDQRKIATVTPYRDGMNLVAKEFIAAQDPNNAGVLILSAGAGAAAELHLGGHGALVYDPNDSTLNPDEIYEPIYNAMIEAIQMQQQDANQRHSLMLSQVQDNDIGKWGGYHFNVINDLRPVQQVQPRFATPAP